MMTDKKLSTFSRPALSVSTEIFKNSNAHATNSTSDDSRHQFVHLYNEGQVLAETLGF